MTFELVLLRHGQSEWNLENRFTGWVDVGLSPRGVEEARSAGIALKQENYQFDLALTSVLRRSIDTLSEVLQQLGQTDIPVQRDWHLNERHYGALQGLNKAEMVQMHGPEQVHRWRRGYSIRPPELAQPQWNELKADPKYAHLDAVPATESLADTYTRVVRYWNNSVMHQILSGKRILIVAHGNSLRALVKYLDNISDEEITTLNIPTGIALVYHLDPDLFPIRHFYLADDATLEKFITEVRNQTQTSNP
ncbi:MAG: 2,3-diphosphoglycerate-dependent phosphoglycerate mutase [Acidiferrobacterales bacterium]|nr:2,3-diphosphoglycerate-dependent phosphoglycerate mutase [Acidiferrobacterales bacterium]